MKRYILGTMITIGFAVIFASITMAFPEKSAPGLYVHSQAEFAVIYPQNWAEQEPDQRAVFKAASKQRYPYVRVWFLPNLNSPIQNLSRMWVPRYRRAAKEIKMLYDRDTKTDAGIEARELEMEFYPKAGSSRTAKANIYFFGVKNNKGWIVVVVYGITGNLDDDLKQIAKSVQLKSRQQG